MACIGKRCKLMIMFCRHPVQDLEMLQWGNTRAKPNIIRAVVPVFERKNGELPRFISSKLLVFHIYEDKIAFPPFPICSIEISFYSFISQWIEESTQSIEISSKQNAGRRKKSLQTKHFGKTIPTVFSQLPDHRTPEKELGQDALFELSSPSS